MDACTGMACVEVCARVFNFDSFDEIMHGTKNFSILTLGPARTTYTSVYVSYIIMWFSVLLHSFADDCQP